MSVWTAKEAAAATGGQANGNWVASGVSIDTRSINPSELYIALRGGRHDGHEFAKEALNKSASAVLVEEVPEGVDPAQCLIVSDTMQAMVDLGLKARMRTGAKIIGVTGSVGKTGTKEMLEAVFRPQIQIHASKKSHNNHWGVPLTLAGMDPGIDVGILEMGMNNAGEIAGLTRMVRPHIAIITAIEAVHLENLGSLENIARAKAEIFEGLQPGGAAILNKDNDFFSRVQDIAEENGARIFSFGWDSEADAQLIECLAAANGTRVKARIGGQEISFTMAVSGEHHAMNAMATLLAVHVAGYDVQNAAHSLQSWMPSGGRGKRETLNIGDPDNPITLLDESYNASPAAMRAAFKVLALVDPGRGGRRIAVLGDMAELGPDAARLHAELALPLEAAGVRLVYTCGPLMKNLQDTLANDFRGGHRDTPEGLAEIVPEVIVPGDVILVKGSRGPGEQPKMQVILEALRSKSI